MKPNLTSTVPTNPIGLLVHEISDGDTLRADLLLPFKITITNQTIRAWGYDAWEITKTRRTVTVTPEEKAKGYAAREALISLHRQGSIWAEDTQLRDPYGRLSCRLWAKTPEGLWLDIASWMKEQGHCRSTAKK